MSRSSKKKPTSETQIPRKEKYISGVGLSSALPMLSSTSEKTFLKADGAERHLGNLSDVTQFSAKEIPLDPPYTFENHRLTDLVDSSPANDTDTVPICTRRVDTSPITG